MTVLPIPSPLVGDWTAPAGTYSAPATVNANASCTVDLTACTVNGTSAGFLFKPKAGVNLTVKLGTVTNMQGIESNDGGRLDAKITGITATGLGAGIRTYGSAEAYNCFLTGGANPQTGDPCGVRGLDLNDTATVVPDQVVIVRDCAITGFTGGNSDGCGAEETVAYFEVSRSQFSTFSDAAVDSKAAVAVVVGNTFSGFYGVRIVDSHIGRLYSAHNDYIVPTGVYGLQASSGYGTDPQHPTDPGLTSLGDTFHLAGGLVARALVACQGSTGFSSTRCGVIRLIGSTWDGTNPTPWVAPHGVCSTDGLDYFPSVIAG